MCYKLGTGAEGRGRTRSVPSRWWCEASLHGPYTLPLLEEELLWMWTLMGSHVMLHFCDYRVRSHC